MGVSVTIHLSFLKRRYSDGSAGRLKSRWLQNQLAIFLRVRLTMYQKSWF